MKVRPKVLRKMESRELDPSDNAPDKTYPTFSIVEKPRAEAIA